MVDFGGFDLKADLITSLYVFMLAAFLGFELVKRVSLDANHQP